jgi:hypothetical protein
MWEMQMKRITPILMALAASAALLPLMCFAQSTTNSAGNCNRDCMEGYAVMFSKALLKHDASSLPLAKNVKVTENAKPSSLSSGIWTSITRFLSNTSTTQFVTDFTTGQVGMMGVVEDKQDGKLVPAMYALRLKIDGGKITEVEQIVKHESDTGGPFQPEGFIWREAPYIRTIPPKLYTDRKGLARTADIYWNVATTTHNGYLVPYTVDCFHVENGMLGSFERPLDSLESYYPENNPQSDFDGRIWTCEREHTLSTAAWTKYKTHRRLIDEERGLVMDWNLVERTTGSFKITTEMPDGSPFKPIKYGPPSRGADGWPRQTPGTVPGEATTPTGVAPGGGGMGAATVMAPAGPSDNYHAQLFRIVNGKIAREQVIWLTEPIGTASPF